MGRPKQEKEKSRKTHGNSQRRQAERRGRARECSGELPGVPDKSYVKREAGKPLSHLPGHSIGFVLSGTSPIPMAQLGLQKQKAGELVAVASLDVP